MQPNTKPVIFDFTSAETFVSALKKCKEKIENQIPERNKVTEYAKTELKGKNTTDFIDFAVLISHSENQIPIEEIFKK